LALPDWAGNDVEINKEKAVFRRINCRFFYRVKIVSCRMGSR
jgi:hypothetical protein